METQLLDVADTAKVLKISGRSVRKLIDRGELPPVWVGGALRIDPAALAAWIASGGVGKSAEPRATK
jgi:excisionase family DNA binding protein